MRPPLPPTLGDRADPNRLHAFMESIFRPDYPYRIGVRRLLNRARLYRAGVQWLEPVLDDGYMMADWQVLQQDDLNGIPMPVQNEIFPLVTREAALLTKVGERPYIRPNRDDPETAKAAQFAKDILIAENEEVGWHDIEREGGTHCATYGTWWLASWMDYDYTKTTRVPIEGGLKCPEPGCDVTFAGARLEDDEAAKIAEVSPWSVQPGAAENDPATIARCPRCLEHTERGMVPSFSESGLVAGTQPGMVKAPGAPKLVPFIPSEDQALTGQDFLGRPLGDDVPIGQAAVENISPFDANPNPSSQGVDTNSRNWEEFAWACPRSLDWIRSRFPKNGWKVKPEQGHEIWRNHPVLGGLGSGGITIGGPDMFQNHALVKIFVKKPYMALEQDEDGIKTEEGSPGLARKNQGRLIIEANHVVLLDADLMVESQVTPGEYLSRIHFDWAWWEQRDREAHGIGMVELLWSQQDSINTNKSQQMDARHRFANPKWLAEDGVEFDYKGGAGSNYNSDFLIWTRSTKEQQPPREFQGMTIPNSVFSEFTNDIEACPRIVLAAEVEGGEPPGGVEAYSALLLLAQKAADTRKPRTERIRDMKQRVFRHRLQLVQEFYREPRLMRMRGANDKWSVKEFEGMDLQGQVDVQFDVEPVIDVGIVRREGIQLGIKLGTIVPDTAPAKWRLNKALEIPNDINEDSNQQVQHAENEAIAWLADDEDWPLINESGDSDQIHWDVHKEALQQEKWRELAKACQWKRAQIALWGWEEEFLGLLAMEAQFKVAPPTEPPMEIAAIHGPDAYTHAMESYQRQLQIQELIASWPKPMELRIMKTWQGILQSSGLLDEAMTPVGLDQNGLHAWRKVFRFEAHAEGHRLRMEEKAKAATMGDMQAAAPGASQTDQGMIPAPGQAASAPAGGSAGSGAVPSGVPS